MAKKKKFGAYVHIRKNGSPFYVGKGTIERANQKWRNPWHDNIVRKEGWENIAIRFYSCSSEKNAFKREKKLIANYINRGIQLTNFTDGGEGISGYKFPEKTLIKMGKIQKAIWKNEEYKKMMSEIQRISTRRSWKNPRTRKIRLAAAKKAAPKIKIATTKNWKNKKMRRKMMIARKATYADPERAKKISLGMQKTIHTKRYKKQRKRLSREMWRRPGFREEQCKKYKKGNGTPEARKRNSERTAKLWQCPKHRKRMLKAFAKARNAKKRRS